MIRPSFGFFVTMALMALFSAGVAMLGGYWNFHARKVAAGLFGFVVGVFFVWFSIHLLLRAVALAREKKALSR